MNHFAISVKRILLSLLFLFFLSVISGQEEAAKAPDRPVADIFGSTLLIDNQTVVVPFKGTFQFDIQHRFGTWDKGYDDFWGLFAPSNFRLGFNYVPVNNLQLGFGFAKDNLLWNFNAKYAIMQQSRSGAKPLSITYLVDAAVDTRGIEKTIYNKDGDRLAYFHQLMIARKLSEKLSLQVSGNVTHFNFVDAALNENNEVIAKRKNNHISTSVLGRMKLGESSAFIANVDFPITDHNITDHNINSPKTNVSFGIEFVTSAHAFQIFVGNSKTILPQYNNFFNNNSFGDNKILIGFNMTRLWSF